MILLLSCRAPMKTSDSSTGSTWRAYRVPAQSASAPSQHSGCSAWAGVGANFDIHMVFSPLLYSDPLLDIKVDPPAYGWPKASVYVFFNQTRQRGSINPNKIGVDGRTALHVAALFGDDRIELARALLKMGADVSIPNRRGETPLAYAERFGRTRLAALYRSAAKPSPSPAILAKHILPRPPSTQSPSVLPPLVLNDSLATSRRCCIHSCHGRGRCVDGVCKCDAGSHGFDCGLNSSRPFAAAGASPSSSPPASCPHGRRMGLYVGRIGLQLSERTPTPVLRRNGFANDCIQSKAGAATVRTIDPAVHGIYAPLDLFLLRMLDDPTLRAPSVECAQVCN